MDTYDLAVIGGGSAGQTAAFIAGTAGAKVVLVDRQRLGGDCLHHGCVPSKALIHCARMAHQASRASRFGVSTGEVKVDFARAMDHVAEAIETVGESETPEVFKEHGVEVAFGGARFLSPTTLQIGEDREIATARSIIAVGSRAVAPAIEGLEQASYLDHVSLFAQRELPARLAVLGGGPVGVEMGQALARLGSQVTILQSDSHILTRDDPELTELLAGYLREELDLRCNARVTEVRTTGGGKKVRYVQDGKKRSIAVDEVLVAVGRKPNLEALDLKAAGVDRSAQGIVVDSCLRSSARNIWACGDCTGSYQFTHFAEAQARVAARNALFTGNKSFNERWVPWTTFADPELAHVGMLEDEAREQHGDVEVYRFSYGELDRAVCEGSARGLAKVVCSSRDRILGASLLGPHAGEAISELTIALKAGIKLNKLTGYIHVYPTYNRIVRRLGDQRFFNKGIGSTTRKLFGQFKG